MDLDAHKSALSSNTIGLVDSSFMPDSVYPLVWSFLLDTTCSRAYLLEFKSIRSFMLVNKTSKGAFDDCRGWWFCAKALKREDVAKRWLMYDYIKSMQIRRTGINLTDGVIILFPETDWARETNSRIVLIRKMLLPAVGRLSAPGESEEVSMDEYDSSMMSLCIFLMEFSNSMSMDRHYRLG
jgi:hypothetical protein